MHNSPLKCTTNDGGSVSPVKNEGLKSDYSHSKQSPLKAAGASQISPEKRTRENIGTNEYQSPPRSRKINSPSKLKTSPTS